MSRKGENIFKRKDGRWEARYIKGHDLSGKIKYGFCYGKTYKEAKTKVTKIKASLLNGAATTNENNRHRMSFFCDEWLFMQKNRLKTSTYAKYENVINKHIRPLLGDCYPIAIDERVIEDFKNKLLQKGFAPKTVKDILVILRSVLLYTRKQLPGVFPAIDITYPKESVKEMRVLTKEEQKKVMEYLLQDMDHCKFGVLLAMLTGIRIGELCALQWNHISLTNKTLKITQSMQRLKDYDENCLAKTRVSIGQPKTNHSMRTIPLTNCTKELCAKMQPLNSSFFVLTGTERYMEPRVLQYRFAKYMRECGLEGVHFHTLRHTFATRCIEVGFEIKSLSEILGHANTAITMNRYVHSSIILKRENMEKLNSMDCCNCNYSQSEF